jgi:hypothetical protein
MTVRKHLKKTPGTITLKSHVTRMLVAKKKAADKRTDIMMSEVEKQELKDLWRGL